MTTAVDDGAAALAPAEVGSFAAVQISSQPTLDAEGVATALPAGAGDLVGGRLEGMRTILNLIWLVFGRLLAGCRLRGRRH